MRYTKYYLLIVLTLFVTIGMAAQTGNRLYIDDVQMSANSQKLISVRMDNEDEIVAVEMILDIPEGFYVMPNSFILSDRSDGHQITAKEMDDNQYKIMIISTDNKPIKGIAGTLFTIMLENDLYEEDDYIISISDAVMAISTGENVLNNTKDGIVTICSLPNLHVVSVECSAPIAGQEMTVRWKVRNDGQGCTPNIQWYDYIWLVSDIYQGTATSGSKLLATCTNISTLESGDYYENTVNIALEESIYGNYYLLVTSDMSGVNDIDFSSTNGVPPNPYQPESESYGFLKGRTTKQSVRIEEEGEPDGISDNFFYKRINIAIPPLPDIQVPQVVAVVDNDHPDQSPSPINNAGLASSSAFYSGKNIKVTATITNQGGADINSTSINNELYISSTPELGSGEELRLATNTTDIELKIGETTTITFSATIPYEWHGDTYFIVKANVNDDVNELANTSNNSGVSNLINTLLTPGADFEPYDISVPSQLSLSAPFDVSYSVRDIGPGVPYNNHWQDAIYISAKNTGIDETAKLLSVIPHTGSYVEESEGYRYSGDDYSETKTIHINNLPSGTYYIYVKVDAQDAVYEYDGESNNVIMSKAVLLSAPDLTTELVSVSGETISTGSTIAVTWKLKNIGTANIQSVAVMDRFYASTSSSGNYAIPLDTATNVISIVAGGEKILRSLIKIPYNNSLEGSYYIFAETNTNHAIKEENLSNNTSVAIPKQFTSSGILVDGVNLTVSSLLVPVTATIGENLPISYTIKNTGTVTISKEITQEIYISKKNKFDSSAKKLTVTGTLPSIYGLLSGESVSANVNISIPRDIMGGKNFIHVIINGDRALAEKIAEDNQVSSSIFVDGNLPNLVITNLIVPSTIKTSEKTEVSWILTNLGDWDAEASTCGIYLSTDANYDKDAKLLTRINSPRLTKNASQTMKTDIELSDDIKGMHYLIVKADMYNEVEEIYTDDNLESATFLSVQSPLPDLTASNLCSEGTWRGGNTVNVKATVKNTGDSETRTDKWTDVFYLSEGYTLNVKKAIKLGSKTHVGKLEKNGVYEISADLIIPSNINGYYVLFAVADGTSAMTEKTKENNQIKIPVYIEDPNDMPANLIITKMAVPSRITAGEPITISYNIANQGEYAADGLLRDVLYMSKDNQWDENDVMVGVVTGNVEMEPGTEITRSVTGRITNIPEGDYYLIVRTNSTHTIAENDYDNNQIVQNSPCTLAFQTLNLGSSVTVNTSGLFKLPLHSGLNGKTIGLYLTTPESSSAGLYAAYESVPSTARYERSASDIESTEQEVLIPDVQEGNYYILAQDNAAISRSLNEFVIDGEEQQEETMMNLSAREVPFGATSLSITEGGTNGWISTEIHGALLDSIMDFRLARENEEIPIERMLFQDQTSSYVTFNLNDAETGSYDIVSELPNGMRASLPEGFKVIPGQSVNLGVKLNLPNNIREGTYAPISIAYANSGNTDITIKELIVVATNAYISNTVKGLTEKNTEMHIVPSYPKDRRGFVSIPPNVQEVFNCFIKAFSNCTITVYVVK